MVAFMVMVIRILILILKRHGVHSMLWSEKGSAQNDRLRKDIPMTACDCRYLQIFFLMGLKDLCCRYRSRHRDTGLAVPEGRHYHVFVFSDSYGSFFQAILATAASVVFSLLLLEQSAWRAWHLRQRQHIPRHCAQRCHLKQRLRLETCLKKHRKGTKKHIWNSRRSHSDMLPFVCSVCTRLY